MQNRNFIGHDFVNSGTYVKFADLNQDEETMPMAHVFLLTTYSVLNIDDMIDKIKVSTEIALDEETDKYTGFHDALKEDYNTNFLEEVLTGTYDDMLIGGYHNYLENTKLEPDATYFEIKSGLVSFMKGMSKNHAFDYAFDNMEDGRILRLKLNNGTLPKRNTIETLINEGANMTKSMFILPENYNSENLSRIVSTLYDENALEISIDNTDYENQNRIFYLFDGINDNEEGTLEVVETREPEIGLGYISFGDDTLPILFLRS